METMKRNKFVATFTSRKVWISIVGLLISFGLLNFTPEQGGELAGTIAAGLTAVLTLGIALEDGLRGIGKPPAPAPVPTEPAPVPPAPTEPPAAG